VLGTLLGNYRVVQRLGEGGMGVVYLGRHEALGHRVVVKLLLPELSRDRNMVQRFFHEAQAATAIRSPGIAQVFDFGVAADGRAYIIMERLDGESLAARLKQARYDAVDICRFGRQVADVLHAAHAAGIIHRDLKPDNLFLVSDPEVIGGERVKVLDFGIAKLVGDAHASGVKTVTNLAMGRPDYMSPEQCRSASAADARSDIYSLGCILFELACGRPPFASPNLADVVAAHLHDPPPHPLSIESDLPPRLAALILRMLAKHADARPQTMEVVSQALAEVLSTLDDDPPAAPADAPVSSAGAPAAALSASPSAPTRPSPASPSASASVSASAPTGPASALPSAPARPSPSPSPSPTASEARSSTPAARSAPASASPFAAPAPSVRPSPAGPSSVTLAAGLPSSAASPSRSPSLPTAPAGRRSAPSKPPTPARSGRGARAASPSPVRPGALPAIERTRITRVRRPSGWRMLFMAGSVVCAGIVGALVFVLAVDHSASSASSARKLVSYGDITASRVVEGSRDPGPVSPTPVPVPRAAAATTMISAATAAPTSAAPTAATARSGASRAAGQVAPADAADTIARECSGHLLTRRWQSLAQCAARLQRLDAGRAAELGARATEELRSAPHSTAAFAALRDHNLKHAKIELDQVWSGSVELAALRRAYDLAEAKEIDALATELDSLRDPTCNAFHERLAAVRTRSPARVLAEVTHRVRCAPAPAAPAQVPSPPPGCDADALAAEGGRQFSAGHLAESFVSYEAAYNCQPSGPLLQKQLVVACNLQDEHRAKAIWKRLSEPQRTSPLLAICIRNGLPEATLSAP
jgi:serine/threonine protein kinase